MPGLPPATLPLRAPRARPPVERVASGLAHGVPGTRRRWGARRGRRGRAGETDLRPARRLRRGRARAITKTNHRGRRAPRGFARKGGASESDAFRFPEAAHTSLPTAGRRVAPQQCRGGWGSPAMGMIAGKPILWRPLDLQRPRSWPRPGEGRTSERRPRPRTPPKGSACEGSLSSDVVAAFKPGPSGSACAARSLASRADSSAPPSRPRPGSRAPGSPTWPAPPTWASWSSSPGGACASLGLAWRGRTPRRIAHACGRRPGRRGESPRAAPPVSRV